MADPDVVVVGAGPNGLVAAVELAGAGRRVLVVEAAPTPGGGVRSERLLRPDVVHDVCSTIHSLALGSPALRDLPLERHGVRWVHPDVPLAHVLDGGRRALLHRSVEETAAGLGGDGDRYRRRFGPLVRAGTDLTDQLLSPLAVPRHPLVLARFGWLGIRPATMVPFATEEAAGLFAGLSAHSILSLRAPVTAGYGLMLGSLAHTVGWPYVAGGSQRLADALVALLEERGGRVECGRPVRSVDELPPGADVVLDLSPRQVVAVAGHRLPDRYRRRLERFRLGPGVHKVDWILDGPIPWRARDVARAGTVHVGGTAAEVVAAEGAVQRGRHPDRPFLLVTQPTQFDGRRAPAGVHVAWGYCHVPNGSTVDMTAAVEAQIERFAPGFRDRIVARHVMGPAAIERHDANYVGGDIAGGRADLRQFFARPVLGLHPWRMPAERLFLCSASTPPGAGAHGMGGHHAAREVLAAGRRR